MPFPSLRAGALATEAVALAVLVALAVWLRGALSLSGAYPLKVTASFAVVMVLTWTSVRETHGFAIFGPANRVTTARAAMVALLVGLIAEQETTPVATTIVAASLVVTLLDGVDGWLARRSGMSSAFGARFDMETDSVLILALAILVWEHGKAGGWVIGSGLLRYLFVAAGWIRPWMRRPLPPTPRGKIICVAQIVALILAIAPLVEPPASSAIAAAGLGALCYSFSVDTLWLWRHAGHQGPLYSRTP